MKKMVMNSLGSITEFIDDEEFTMRDYFAAKAMMIAIRLFDEQSMEIPYIGEDGEPMDYEEGSSGTWFPHTKQFGETCYAIADAMMEARNVTK
jgi:hypothetical protein